MRRLLLMRGTFTIVLGVLAVIAFASGEEIFGALLAGFAITNMVLITIFTWHQVKAASRPPAPPARRPR
jgi:hypothetical protein